MTKAEPRIPDAPRDPIAELRKRARILEQLLDDRGRVARWPVRRAQQLIVLDYIAAQIEAGVVMTEREVGTRLDALHAFDDAALIRRELVDLGALQRKRDGSAYWKADDAGDAERWAAIEGSGGRRQT